MEELTPVQVRIMGCLLEKERTTPDNYPLTMNGLLLACNQSTNRFPVVSYNDATVGNALTNLRSAGLVRIVYSRSNRAEKYRHVLDEVLELSDAQLALLSVLMVRGPQTVPELRSRTERLHQFGDQSAVEDALGQLCGRDQPMVTLLGRAPGQKEDRWAQLLGGPVSIDDIPAPTESSRSGGRSDRVGALETDVAELKGEVESLRRDYAVLIARLGDLLE